jgi:hypothetical protein
MYVVFNSIQNINKQLGKFISPFLCIGAGIEKVIDPFGPVDLYKESPSPDKTLIYC